MEKGGRGELPSLPSLSHIFSRHIFDGRRKRRMEKGGRGEWRKEEEEEEDGGRGEWRKDEEEEDAIGGRGEWRKEEEKEDGGRGGLLIISYLSFAA
jgi:hypothetical protein